MILENLIDAGNIGLTKVSQNLENYTKEEYSALLTYEIRTEMGKFIMISENQELVQEIAKKYIETHKDKELILEDLIKAGNIGLTKAVEEIFNSIKEGKIDLKEEEYSALFAYEIRTEMGKLV